MVLVYDLLFGKGVQCGGPFKRLLMNNKSDLKAALASTTVDNRDNGSEYQCKASLAVVYFGLYNSSPV